MHWTSYGHDRAGVPIARGFLERIGMDAGLIARVAPLVESHMQYHAFKDPHADLHTVRRLAYRLAPATMRQLGRLIEADHSGRPPLPKRIPEAAARMLELAEKAGVMDGFARR
jgi:tRNA nucleotidyltransferase (CCA-adding enzyme)